MTSSYNRIYGVLRQIIGNVDLEVEIRVKEPSISGVIKKFKHLAAGSQELLQTTRLRHTKAWLRASLKLRADTSPRQAAAIDGGLKPFVVYLLVFTTAFHLEDRAIE